MSGPLKRYAFINAKLKTRLSAVLSDEFYQKMLNSPTLNEAVQLLHDTPYGSVEAVYASTGDLKMCERELLSLEIHHFSGLRKFLEEDLLHFLDALLLRFEIQNLKEALRLWLDRAVRSRDITDTAGYLYRDFIVHKIDFTGIINAQDASSLLGVLEGTPYADLLSKRLDSIWSSKSLFTFENDLDHYYYRNLLDRAALLDSGDFSILKKIVGVEIDLENLSRMLRFRSYYNLEASEIRRYLLPGGSRLSRKSITAALGSGEKDELPAVMSAAYPDLKVLGGGDSHSTANRLLLLEELLQQIMMTEVRHLLLGNPFTVGTLLAYFFIKRREVHRITAVLNAKQYGMSDEPAWGGL